MASIDRSRYGDRAQPGFGRGLGMLSLVAGLRLAGEPSLQVRTPVELYPAPHFGKLAGQLQETREALSSRPTLSAPSRRAGHGLAALGGGFA